MYKNQDQESNLIDGDIIHYFLIRLSLEKRLFEPETYNNNLQSELLYTEAEPKAMLEK